MKLGIVGIGHVGLPTGAALANLGHDVVATDSDSAKLDLLAEGIMPFQEPDLADLVDEGMQSGGLRFSADPADAVDGADAVFLCVGTPAGITGDANLIAVERSAVAVAQHATSDLVVVEKSTVPTGTAERIAETLHRHNPAVTFSMVCNPEFLREGSAVEDSLHPTRILVGSSSEKGFALMRDLYEPLVLRGASWIETDLRTAELAKHACNAFLALKISYANALACICDRSGADVVDVQRVMGEDPRIGGQHLEAGLGFGGSCFPKDLAAFERLTQRLGYRFPLLREVSAINDEAVEEVYRKIERALWILEGKRIALLGLAFKPGTDDVRYSPALALARRLLSANACVVGYDPCAADNAATAAPDLTTSTDIYGALLEADCAVVCTPWQEIRALDLVRAKEVMHLPIIVDGRNLFDRQMIAAAGFDYWPVGRPPSVSVPEERWHSVGYR